VALLSQITQHCSRQFLSHDLASPSFSLTLTTY
jgi:hypothetical protein